MSKAVAMMKEQMREDANRALERTIQRAQDPIMNPDSAAYLTLVEALRHYLDTLDALRLVVWTDATYELAAYEENLIRALLRWPHRPGFRPI